MFSDIDIYGIHCKNFTTSIQKFRIQCHLIVFEVFVTISHRIKLTIIFIIICRSDSINSNSYFYKIYIYVLTRTYASDILWCVCVNYVDTKENGTD